MRIQNNIPAYNTHRQYNIANGAVASSAEKLSSGYRINRAGDDAAGLAISEKMRAQIRGLEMASKNSMDAVSLVQTAEGALQETHNILQRMRELSVQSASDTNEQTIDRAALNAEFQQLKEEINEIADKTRFNDQNLIDGNFQKQFFATDITSSKLQTGVSANVSRVGVSGKPVGDSVKVSVNFQEARAAINATSSTVTNTILTTPTTKTSAVSYARFDAVLGTEHANKTFKISAIVDGDQSKNLSDLKVKITDGTRTIEGKIDFSGDIASGGKMTINFAGVGQLTMNIKEDLSQNANYSNISDALNTQTLKFTNSVVLSGEGAALKGASSFSLTNDTYANGFLAETTNIVGGVAGAYTGTSLTLANTATTAGAVRFFKAGEALTAGTAPAGITYDYIDRDGGKDVSKAGVLRLTFTGVGSIDMELGADAAVIDGATAATRINGALGALLTTTTAANPAANEVTHLAGFASGSDYIAGTEKGIFLSVNGEVVNLKENDTYANFDKTGVSLSFNALDMALVTNNATAVSRFTTNAAGLEIGIIKADGKDMTIQSGANQGDELSINIDAMNLNMLGLTHSNIASRNKASEAITLVNNAINQVSTQRSKLGALQNRLGHKIANLDTSAENLTASESRIRDVDMAKEMTAFSKKNILVQAATAMLAQANSLPQNVLQLLR